MSGRGYDGLCGSGKRAYESRQEAKLARRRMSSNREVEGLRPYRCDECGMWHLGHHIGFRNRPGALPVVECAKRLAAGRRDNCPKPGVHLLETSAGHAWLCEEHWQELGRLRARKAVA